MAFTGSQKQMILKLTADVSSLKAQLNRGKTHVNAFASSMNKLGGIMAAAFSVHALVNFAKESVHLAKEQIKAEKIVEQAIRSTGGAAGYGADELKRMASQMQAVTNFGDEVILKNVTAQLLTFTQITKTNFAEAQEAVLNMATVLDKDLTTTAIQVGKALNYPVTGVSALRRIGVQFSKDQVEVIKKLAETNRVAEAQALILRELATEFGGQARNLANPINQLSNAWGDFREELGKKSLPVLKQIATVLKEIVETGTHTIKKGSFWDLFTTEFWWTAGFQAIGALKQAKANAADTSGADSANEQRKNKQKEIDENSIRNIKRLIRNNEELTDTQQKRYKEEFDAFKKRSNAWEFENAQWHRQIALADEFNKKIRDELSASAEQFIDIWSKGFGPAVAQGDPLGHNAMEQKILEDADKMAEKIKKKFVDISEVTAQSIRDTIAGGLVALGEALGGMGLEKIKSPFDKILMVVLGFAKSFGEVLIGLGVAGLALKKLIVDPVTAIIAGIALVALASAGQAAIQKKHSKMEASIPSYDVGTPYVPRTGLAMVHQGEAIIPKGSNWGGSLRVSIPLRQLVIELDRERERMGR